MSYLYGDSTLSKLEVNYIELLRDAVDCCVQVLLADQRIGEGAARTRALDGATAAEIAKLQNVGGLVPKAFEGTPVGEPASATARCVAAIVRSAADIVGAATAEATATLQSAVSRRDAEAALEREALVKALETLLIKHDLPDMKSDADVGLVGGTRYACRLRVATPFGLVRADGAGGAGRAPPRAGRPRRSPGRAAGGAGARDVRLAAQGDEAARAAPGEAPPHRRFRAGARPASCGCGSGPTAPARGTTSSSRRRGSRSGWSGSTSSRNARSRSRPRRPTPPSSARCATRWPRPWRSSGGTARSILDAKLEGEALANHAQPSLLVERIIAQLVPETREIAARSQSVGELVLRRALGGDRREEIFLSKQDLKAKIEPLNDRNRALFDALLDGAPAGRATSRRPRRPSGPSRRPRHRREASRRPPPRRCPTASGGPCCARR